MLESFGITPSLTSVSSSIHSATDNVTTACGLPAASNATEQHVYSLDWRPNSLEFAVDGITYQYIHASQLKSWPFGQPFFVILSLAVGGTMGGAVPATAPLPYRMTVDYIRLYNAEIAQ